MTPQSIYRLVTDGNQSVTVYSPVHSVHLADIKSRAVARKPRNAVAVFFRLKFAEDIKSLRVAELESIRRNVIRRNGAEPAWNWSVLVEGCLEA